MRLIALVLGLMILAAPAAWAQLPCPCILQNNGGGTADMPPDCVDDYVGKLLIDDGVPGGTIEIDPAQLTDLANKTEVPGGALGGTTSTFDAVLFMTMSGTGSLNGFARNIAMLVSVEVDWAPRVPGDAVQSFAGDVVSITGNLFGDPDFDSLSLIGGSNFGLPSPGQTTLTRLGPPGSDFQVDSFFDVHYEITFVGAPGSALEGMGGTTNHIDRFSICDSGPVPVEARSWGAVKSLYDE